MRFIFTEVCTKSLTSKLNARSLLSSSEVKGVWIIPHKNYILLLFLPITWDLNGNITANVSLTDCCKWIQNSITFFSVASVPIKVAFCHVCIQCDYIQHAQYCCDNVSWDSRAQQIIVFMLIFFMLHSFFGSCQILFAIFYLIFNQMNYKTAKSIVRHSFPFLYISPMFGVILCTSKTLMIFKILVTFFYLSYLPFVALLTLWHLFCFEPIIPAKLITLKTFNSAFYIHA